MLVSYEVTKEHYIHEYMDLQINGYTTYLFFLTNTSITFLNYNFLQIIVSHNLPQSLFGIIATVIYNYHMAVTKACFHRRISIIIRLVKYKATADSIVSI